MWPPSPGRAGTDGRCFASDGRCHLPSGHASSPLERQQSRRARRAPAPQGGSSPTQLHRDGEELPGSKKPGGSPQPVWLCREENPAALGGSAGGCSQSPPSSAGSFLGSCRVCKHIPRIRACGRDPAVGSQHPWEEDAGAELAQGWGEKQGPSQTGGLNPAAPGFNTLLKPSYLKMMGKWEKKAQDFEQELRGKDFPCSLQGCVEQQPQAWLAAARDARGRAGRDQTWD